jgi:hypothetical protein
MNTTYFPIDANARVITSMALRELYPDIVEGSDYKLSDTGAILSWKPVPYKACPAPLKLTSLRDKIIARENARLDLQRRRNQMRDMFEALPIVTKAMLRNEFLTVNSILDSAKPGCIEEVRIRISMVTRPDGIELTTEQFDTVKAEILALLPES